MKTALLLLLALALASCGSETGKPTKRSQTVKSSPINRPDMSSSGVVKSVTDGDTIRLKDDRRVRFVQIDTPEVFGSNAECHGLQSSATLRKFLRRGDRVDLEIDPRLGKRDDYGRVLAYVWRPKDPEPLNVMMVRLGAATVWFYDGVRGRYADKLLAAQSAARADERGLWRACPDAPDDPTRGAQTGSR